MLERKVLETFALKFKKMEYFYRFEKSSWTGWSNENKRIK
jgi:hypothetical protein